MQWILGKMKIFNTKFICSPSIRSNSLKNVSKYLSTLLMLWLVQYWYNIPDIALSQKRRRFLQLQTKQLCQSTKFSLSPHPPPPIIRCNSSDFSLVSDQLLSHLKHNCLKDFLVWFLVDLKFSVQSMPRWTAAWRVTDRNIHHMAAFTSRFFIWSLGLRPFLCFTIEKTFSMRYAICWKM